jgi:ribosomal protein S18 acetylase RimI-like enzyme
MSIRIAEPDDAAVIGNLVVQLGYPNTTDDARRRLVQLLGRADHAVFVAAESDGVIGFIHICVNETVEHEPRAEIKGFAVGEGHQSRGIGAQLLDAAEGWAKQRGLSTVRVRSNVKRDRARSFYERHGYEVMKVQNIFDKKLL